MAKFTDYTQKTKPADADLLLIHDNAGAANKKTPFSGVWSWILDKLASAVISQLETSNKSIIPAINELNSKSQSASYSAGDVIPKNSNLNDYTQPGVYRIESSSEASTIKNLPDGVTTGCRIEVSVAGTGWIRQCLYPNNNTNIYIRVTANDYSFSSPWYVLRPSALT